MKKKLFLDDEREPFEAYASLLSGNNPIYHEDGWVIVRSYDKFVNYLNEHGLPDLISFDHDLGPVPTTGLTCARAVINYCEDRNIDLPNYLVHSANTIGKINIITLLQRYAKFRKECNTPSTGN